MIEGIEKKERKERKEGLPEGLEAPGEETVAKGKRVSRNQEADSKVEKTKL